MSLKKTHVFIGAIIILVTVVGLMKIFTPKGIDPASYGAFARGNQYLKKGDYESAIIAFKSVVERNPDFIQGHFNLGCAYDAAGLVAPAVRSYQRALEIDPHYAKAYFNLGNIHDIMGKRQEAITYYRTLLEMNPYHREALFALITDYARTRRIGDARAHLDAARVWLESKEDQKKLDELELIIDEEELEYMRRQQRSGGAV